MFSNIVRHAVSICRYTFRHRPGPVPQTGQAIFLGPLLVGGIAAAAMIFPPQAREVYVALIDGGKVVVLCSILSVVWLSAAIYAWNIVLMNRSIDHRYDEQPSLVVDSWLINVRDLKSMVGAILPLFGLVLGLLAAAPILADAGHQVHAVDKGLALELKNASWLLVGTAVIAACLGAALIGGFLWWQPVSPIRWVHTATKVVAIAVYALPAVVPMVVLVSIARWIGPLCVVSFVMITLIPTVQVITAFFRIVVFGAIVGVFDALTRLFGALVVGLVSAAVGGWLLISALADADKVQDPKGLPPIVVEKGVPIGQSLEDTFDAWLSARGVVPGRSEPYPAFVIAAQGGGIYAAASSMALLAAIEDRCSTFQRHMFAINAVSGGAIGASVYRGLASTSKVPMTGGCAAINSSSMALAVRQIATEDHLSGLLLSTPLDWLSKVPALFARPFADLLEESRFTLLRPTAAVRAAERQGTSTDARQSWLWKVLDGLKASQLNNRAGALTESFESSYGAHSSDRKRDGLTRPVNDYWDATKASPALALALTSVETGYNLSFAPFSLERVGDGTMLSFGDLQRILRLIPLSQKEVAAQTIIGAAVSSARFPGILPAWPIWHTGRAGTYATNSKLNRSNFVDGGYADSTGATAVVDIVTKLKEHIATRGLSDVVKLHVIVLTDNETDRHMGSEPGTNLPDTVAPLTALFSARQLAAARAYTAAQNELKRLNIPLIKIELDHRVFELPLGWLLSQTSNNVLRTMLGSPETCQGDPATHFEFVVRKNGCAQREVLNLLGYRPAPAIKR